MSGGKETPKQKMIGMMYLVLTALLALNVSKEILNAFVIVESGLNTTNANFDGKNGVLYSKFEKAMSDNKVKTKPWYDKALIVRKKSLELCKIIDDIRSELYLKVQKLPSKDVADTFKLAQLDSKDNYDIPTHYLLGATPEEPGPDAKAIELKNAIIKFRKDLIDLVPEKERTNLKLGLNTDDIYSFADEKVVHWEFNNFDHTTMAADMCIFAALKNDIKNAESDVVGLLLKAIDANDFKFDAIGAYVVPVSNYVTAGEDFNADIFISAHSSTQNPEILIGNVDTTSKIPKIVGSGTPVPVTDGVGKYVVHTSAEGDQDYSGVINVKAPDGSIKPYPFHGRYTVAKPSMAISPTKMNVFYIGVDNPVTVAAAGYSVEDVSLSIPGATIKDKEKKGTYDIVVDKPGDVDVDIKAKTKEGPVKTVGGMRVRVKRIPNPVAKVGGIISGNMSAAMFRAQVAPAAILENFEFDAKFVITAFTYSAKPKQGDYQGPYTAEDRNGTRFITNKSIEKLQSGAKPGDKIFIESIKAIGPDKQPRVLNPIIISLN